MKPTKFTDEIGDEIIEKMKAWNAREQHFAVCSGVTYAKGAWNATQWACHRYAQETLLEIQHPDVMGFVYQGVRPDKPNTYSKMTKTGIAYLKCLVDPKGPFKEVLPYLYHSEWKQIIKDNGFVVHSMSAKEFNAGLFWTFIQASRLLFEFKEFAPRFEHLRKYFKDPAWALFATMTFQPVNAQKMDGDWGQAIPLHCAPLGNKPILRAKGFLTGTIVHVPEHKTNNSSICFGGGPVGYIYGGVSSTKKPLDQWKKELKCA